MPRTTVTATIPAGESLSSTVDLSAGSAIFFHMSADWTPALLSFQISADDVTFGDLVDVDGREISINVIPGTVIRVNFVPAAVGWLKFRSGSRFGPVAQTDERVFIISIET